MDSSELLDILGNENRRSILRLLSEKPCYVTEISEYIGVSPKAVIDHLEMLEEAGLVESSVDDSRRKYFRISRSLRLEVSVSPYTFGAKSAYPKRARLDYEYVEIQTESDDDHEEDTDSLQELTARLDRLEEIEKELSMAQRHVQARIDEVMERIEEEMEERKEERADEPLVED